MNASETDKKALSHQGLGVDLKRKGRNFSV